MNNYAAVAAEISRRSTFRYPYLSMFINGANNGPPVNVFNRRTLWLFISILPFVPSLCDAWLAAFLNENKLKSRRRER